MYELSTIGLNSCSVQNNAVLFLTFVSNNSDQCIIYHVDVTARTGLSHNNVATTIRGYCRHFTVQWIESVVHASGHKYGEALKHTNTSMHAYVNIHTEMDTY